MITQPVRSVYLSFGSNVGDRRKNLETAVIELKQKQLKFLKISSIYETAPWGLKDQDAFLNMVTEVETTLSPYKLLKLCLETELKMGRIREVRWGPRIIDIDILYFQSQVINEPDLKIPHPGIPDRNFILQPLKEISPSLMDPKSGKSIEELEKESMDHLDCKKLNLTLKI